MSEAVLGIKSNIVIGWVPNTTEKNEKSQQHFFLAKYNKAKTLIKGVFVGRNQYDTNNGVLIIKAYPSDPTHQFNSKDDIGQDTNELRFLTTKKV